MNLDKLINITGKKGIYKVISKGKNIVVVESLLDKKRIPLHSSSQANMLEEIGIYTYTDTIPLTDVFKKISKKESYKKTISHKSNKDELLNYFRKILPEYDEEKVYISDIKKILQWYNILLEHGIIKEEVKDAFNKEEKRKYENKN
tara:strand:+ start:59 stop:496 length:438 start_codon:yes stop_codon:yes gene_type:complete